jgi:hypothetical protein
VKWDSSRPVPWKRLALEWSIVTLLVVAVMFTFTDEREPEAYAGLLLGGTVYMLVGYALAKLGYQRVRLSQPLLRGSRPAAGPGDTAQAARRPKPAPTRRTSTGPGQARRKRR